MPIDFHDRKNRHSYTTRDAHPDWERLIQAHADVQGKTVLDLGTGGGIYARSLARLGAGSVIAMDFSDEMLAAARENGVDYANIRYAKGHALDTGLPNAEADVVLQRALIHHLPQEQLEPCFREAARVLKPGGTLIVQDRTPEDCLLPGSETHIRGYFFEYAPDLVDKETARRHTHERVTAALAAAGFRSVEAVGLWEERQRHENPARLAEDLRGRTGRSLLHELTDARLEELIAKITASLQPDEPVTEEDRWTVWLARRED